MKSLYFIEIYNNYDRILNMSVLESRKIIIGFVFSFLLTMLINIPIQYLIDYYLVIPDTLYKMSILLEWALLYEIMKRILKVWKYYDKYIFTTLYFILVLSMLMIRYEYGYSVLQLNPFACFREVYYGSYKEWTNFMFNLCIFIPAPLFIYIYTHNWKKSIYICFFLGIFLEFMQCITHRGIFDTGDILLYCIGIIIGYVLSRRYR